MADDSAKWSDVLTLFQSVREKKPRQVLECGAGVSSVAIAYALRQNGREYGIEGRLASMEESSEYLNKMVVSGFPPELAGVVDFRVSPVVFHRYRGINGSSLFGVHYADLPALPYELVYIDGPQYKGAHAFRHLAAGADTSRVSGTPFDSDVIHVLQAADKPIEVLVDMRRDSVHKMRSLLAGAYPAHFSIRRRKTYLTLAPDNVAGISIESA